MRLIADEEYERIPFAYKGDSDQMSKQIPHRLDVVKKFIGRDISKLRTLDVGRSNMFGRLLGLKDNTLSTDLNFELLAPSKDYDLIGCFEIIEHIMNPLRVLIDCHKLLKSGGYLYLSSPRPWLGFLQGRQHFFELKKDRMQRMVEFAGFEVLKVRKFCIWDWDFMFWGIRPFFRVLLHRNYLWELRRP